MKYSQTTSISHSSLASLLSQSLPPSPQQESSGKTMFRRNKRSPGISSHHSQELDLKLNLSPPPRVTTRSPQATVVAGPHRMSTSSPEVSPPRSCVSSEDGLKYSSSPETTSMVLAGCPRCFMYVMLSEADPRCPKCKSTVLLDFLRDGNHNHNINPNLNHDDDDDNMN